MTHYGPIQSIVPDPEDAWLIAACKFVPGGRVYHYLVPEEQELQVGDLVRNPGETGWATIVRFGNNGGSFYSLRAARAFRRKLEEPTASVTYVDGARRHTIELTPGSEVFVRGNVRVECLP